MKNKRLTVACVLGLLFLVSGNTLEAQSPFPLSDDFEDTAGAQSRWTFDPEVPWELNSVQPTLAASHGNL